MFRYQEPEADEIAGDLVGEQLADVAFEAFGVGWFASRASFCAMCIYLGLGSVRSEGVEFFFEDHALR